MRRNLNSTRENFGNYATDDYTAEAIRLIGEHSPEIPLFLTLSHTAVHSANPYDLLQAPQEVIARFSHIKDLQRRKYAGITDSLIPS
jgi:arylsulfatase B